MREAVVLIHGIWLTGFELKPLAVRLKRSGFETQHFSYPSIRRTPRENAERLHQRLQTVDADIVHLVGHSLGGVVILHLFDRFPLQRPGRVLMLGSPLKSCLVAQRLSRIQIAGKLLIGRAGDGGLLGCLPKWRGQRPLGVIAGSKSIGIGRVFVPDLPTPNDGTVAVEETRIPGIDMHLIGPWTHLSMLFSPEVAEASCAFLKTGRFE